MPTHIHNHLSPQTLPLPQAQLLPLGRKPTSKPAPVDSTHPAARTAGGLPQLLQLGGAKPAPATVAATGGGEEEEEAGGMSPGGAPPSPTQSGVGNEVQAAKSGAAGACQDTQGRQTSVYFCMVLSVMLGRRTA
jgi:hypothetical protein